MENLLQQHQQIPGQMVLSSGPKLESVIRYFQKYAQSEHEAKVFFYYYESLGWHTEYQTAIRNWEPLAHDWIMNLEGE